MAGKNEKETTAAGRYGRNGDPGAARMICRIEMDTGGDVKWKH